MASPLQRSLRARFGQSSAQLASGFPHTPSQPALHLTLVRCFRRDQGRIEVVLNEDIRGLGYKNDLVQVRRGYARNILVPRNRAAYATNETRLARSLPPIQLQRPPASLRTTTSLSSTSASSDSAAPASAASNRSRRYLQELTAHVGRLPIVFRREAAAATGRFLGRPIDTSAIYRHLIAAHKTYFLHFADLALPSQPITALGSHPLDIRVRAMSEEGAGGGERGEVVRVEVRVVRCNEADELGRQRKADEAEEAAEEARSRGGADGDDSGAQAGQSKKGRERAGVSKKGASI